MWNSNSGYRGSRGRGRGRTSPNSRGSRGSSSSYQGYRHMSPVSSSSQHQTDPPKEVASGSSRKELIEKPKCLTQITEMHLDEELDTWFKNLQRNLVVCKF